jgi:KUP system potassium uptake protein
MSKTASRESFAALALGAMGVVYGDIGTSPLYTMKEVFSPATGIPLDATHLIGAVSVIFWGLMLVVTLKYVLLILRADNRGEGGIMALTALAAEAAGSTRRRRTALLLAGVLGAALFYGDSVITPAISVLSAVEGLEVATPALKAYVIPISVAVLIGLFAVQRHGTAVVGKLFGPVIVVWFAVLAFFGLLEIVRSRPSWRRSTRCTAWPSCTRGVGRCLPRWAPSCWPSPGPRRCMPTWGISARSPSSSPGPAWCCRPWPSITWARARC